ncbi:MAG: hypothetical protein ACUVX8_09290 [Candidatus Zipacnadales bacterium]
MSWPTMASIVGAVSATLVLLGGCAGEGREPWIVDPALVASWLQTGLTEDGVDAWFIPRILTYRHNGTWRSRSADGSWSRGTYGTREGRLRYTIVDSDDPTNIGHTYTFSYHIMQDILTISGYYHGHYYVASFRRLPYEPTTLG